MRYLGVYFVQSRYLKCSLTVAKRGFYRAAITVSLVKLYTSLFARKAAATSEKSTKHTTKTNKQKRGKKTTLKSGRLVNSVTTNEL